MSKLKSDRNTLQRVVTSFTYPVGSGQVIPAGTLVAVNEWGNALPAGGTYTHHKMQNQFVAGVAAETVDNSGGDDGDKSVIVHQGYFLLDWYIDWVTTTGGPVFTSTNVYDLFSGAIGYSPYSKPIYAVNSTTVTTKEEDQVKHLKRVYVGIAVAVEDGQMWVRIH